MSTGAKRPAEIVVAPADEKAVEMSPSKGKKEEEEKKKEPKLPFHQLFQHATCGDVAVAAACEIGRAHV